MGTENSLFLHEEVTLLALRDEQGTIAPGTMYRYAVGAGLLAELLLSDRIRVEETRKTQLVTLVSSTRVDEVLLDECLDRIAGAKKRASLQTWVSRFAGIKDLQHRVAEQLCKRGILRVDEDKILLIFTRKVYPEVNPEPERKLIERLREAIFTDLEDIVPRTVVLVALANVAGLLKVVFDKKRLKGRQARIEKIIAGEMTAKAAKEAIEAVQAAILATVIMPTLVTTTVSR